jgi:hypothetical protein
MSSHVLSLYHYVESEVPVVSAGDGCRWAENAIQLSISHPSPGPWIRFYSKEGVEEDMMNDKRLF